MYLSGYEQKAFVNCFALFESNFIYIVKKSVYEMSKMTTEQFKPYSSPLDFLVKNETLERDFENLIDEIIIALRNRVQYFRTETRQEFIDNQKIFYTEFYPAMRELELFDKFVYTMNDDIMYEEQRDFPVFNHAFKHYVDYYVTLNETISSDYDLTDTQYESIITTNHSVVINDDLNEICNEFNECLFNNNDLDSLKIRIHNYFVEGKEVTNNAVRINRGNKSKICKIMGDLWKHYKTEAISFEYLSIYPDLFDCIKPEEINTTQRLAVSNVSIKWTKKGLN